MASSSLCHYCLPLVSNPLEPAIRVAEYCAAPPGWWWRAGRPWQAPRPCAIRQWTQLGAYTCTQPPRGLDMPHLTTGFRDQQLPMVAEAAEQLAEAAGRTSSCQTLTLGESGCGLSPWWRRQLAGQHPPPTPQLLQRSFRRAPRWG